MQLINHMRLEFDARPENESFARIAVSAFTVPFNPTLDVLSDIRTAISEAVTIAKKYETPEVAKFINGILGSFARGEVKEKG